MSSNAIVTTVVGWAATAPREIHAGRVPYTSFRLASTPRHFDRAQGVWVEGRTEWLTVKVFRDAAFNVAASISKSDPVIVHGRLQTEEWVGENGPRTTLVLEANAVGHDLTRGTAKFARRVRVSPDQAEDPAEGAPDAEVDPWARDSAGDAAVSEREPSGQEGVPATP